MRYTSAFCAVLLTLCASDIFAADSTQIEMTPRMIDLGAVRPNDPMSGTSTVTVTVRSGSPWQLVAERSGENIQAMSNTAADEQSTRLAIRHQGEEWHSLTAAVPSPVASGEMTGGTTLLLMVSASCTFADSPGPRRAQVRFIAYPAASVGDLEIRYAVAPTVSVMPMQTDTLDGVRVATSGIYPFETQTFLVKANVPWDLEMGMPQALRHRDGTINAPTFIARKGDEQHAVALKPGAPVRVASGLPTGEQGELVVVTLAVSTASFLPAGDYFGQLEAKGSESVGRADRASRKE